MSADVYLSKQSSFCRKTTQKFDDDHKIFLNAILEFDQDKRNDTFSQNFDDT